MSTQDPTQIMTAFKQSGAGNCASVSVIKAALFRYGFDDIFSAKTYSNGQYDLTLKNGTPLTLTDDEIQCVAAKSGFAGFQDSITSDQIYLLYATMVKSKCLQTPGCTELTDVIDQSAGYLDMDTMNNFAYLGLKEQVDSLTEFDVPYLSNLQAYILTNIKHSAFAYGPKYDEMGTPTKIDQFVYNHSSWVTRLALTRNINGAYQLR